MLLTASYWLNGKTQIMGNGGKDLSRNKGFKAASNIELRAVRLFEAKAEGSVCAKGHTAPQMSALTCPAIAPASCTFALQKTA